MAARPAEGLERRAGETAPGIGSPTRASARGPATPAASGKSRIIAAAIPLASSVVSQRSVPTSDPLDQPTGEILAALRDVVCQLAEPTHVLSALLGQAVKRTGADRGLFVEALEDGGLDYRVLSGFQKDDFEGEAGAFSRHLFARVLESGEPLRLDNAAHDHFFAGVESVRGLRTASILCMPVRSGDRIRALIHLENKKAGHFGEAEVKLLQSLLAVAGPVLEVLHAERDGKRDRERSRREAAETRELLAREWSFERYVGRSDAVRALETTVRQAAAVDYPVLLLGEPGTGKNVLARVLHSMGPRATRPFLMVSCPSMEKGLVEAELFGHKRGAFTGALSDREGKVQTADGGTLLLDEIGELPLELQPKLLRFLADRTFERVGDPRERTADVRILAATNRDLEAEVRRGAFRQDLFDRLNFIPIRVPPLRDRRSDIPLLLRHCLDRTPAGRWIEIAPEGMTFLESLEFAWPGNMRHIEHLGARLVMEGRRGPLGPADLDRLLDRRGDATAAPADGAASAIGDGLPSLVDRAERAGILQAINEHPNASRAEIAARLKISESALYRKLKQHGIGE